MTLIQPAMLSQTPGAHGRPARPAAGVASRRRQSAKPATGLRNSGRPAKLRSPCETLACLGDLGVTLSQERGRPSRQRRRALRRPWVGGPGPGGPASSEKGTAQARRSQADRGFAGRPEFRRPEFRRPTGAAPGPAAGETTPCSSCCLIRPRRIRPYRPYRQRLIDPIDNAVLLVLPNTPQAYKAL